MFLNEGALCPKSYNSRKHALECLRLAADCRQMAGDVRTRPLRSHFHQMAELWATLGDWTPSADTKTES